MAKKQQMPGGQELRDQPVPPVKGAVTESRDAVLRPEGMLSPDRRVRLTDLSESGSWL